MRADHSIRLTVVAPEAFRGPEGSAVVVADCPDLPAQDPKAWARIGCLFVGTPDPFGWATARGRVSVAPVTHWAGAHPTLLEIDPTLMRIPEALDFEWASPRTLTDLVSADRTPLIVARTAPDAEGGLTEPANCVYWLFDLNATDLPRRVNFPLLLWNTIDFLAGQPAEAAAVPEITGEPLRVVAGPSARVVGPDGSERALHFDNRDAVVNDTTRQGIYLCYDGPITQPYGVSLLSSRGIAPLPADRPDDVAGRDGASSLSALENWKVRYRKLDWETIVLLAVGLGLCEWLLFHRRIVQVG
jgi:hypothetical protein